MHLVHEVFRNDLYMYHGTNTRNPPRLSLHATQLKREILAGALFNS